MPITLENIREAFDRNFSPPFLPEGLVKTNLENGRLGITIGSRDISINEEGEVIDSGSFLG